MAKTLKPDQPTKSPVFPFNSQSGGMVKEAGDTKDTVIIQSYGKDDSDASYGVKEDRGTTPYGGGTSDLSHSIKPGKAQQGPDGD